MIYSLYQDSVKAKIIKIKGKLIDKEILEVFSRSMLVQAQYFLKLNHQKLVEISLY